jgi:cytochrome P450
MVGSLYQHRWGRPALALDLAADRRRGRVALPANQAGISGHRAGSLHLVCASHARQQAAQDDPGQSRPDQSGDYLARLRELRRQYGAVFPRRRGEIFVADPVIAKEILGNSAGRFRDHSDFFHTRRGTFGPRSAQVSIGRAAKQLLRRHAQTQSRELPALVARRLVPTSSWPDAGNRLLFEHFRGALVGVNPSAALLDIVDSVVERAVLAGARDRYSWLARTRLRARVMRVLSAEIAARRARIGSCPADLLDVIAQAAPAGASNRDLAEVYLSCLFAVVGSVGFLLGWSLYLLGTAGPGTEPTIPAWVVREALRLWPVAWQFGRRPTQVQQLDGVTVTPADDVTVCSYLVHRDPDHWTDPDEFRPSRWSVPGQEAFIPFGWGPHACIGASMSMQIVETLIEIITSTYVLDVTAPDSRPQIAAALAPPRFSLRLSQLSSRAEGR